MPSSLTQQLERSPCHYWMPGEGRENIITAYLSWLKAGLLWQPSLTSQPGGVAAGAAESHQALLSPLESWNVNSDDREGNPLYLSLLTQTGSSMGTFQLDNKIK